MLTQDDDVYRMKAERNISGLIKILNRDIDPLIRRIAAEALGEIADPYDTQVRTALEGCLGGSSYIAGFAQSALNQLDARRMNDVSVQPQKQAVIHRKAAFWVGLLLCFGLCVMVPLMIEMDLPPWTAVIMSLSPIVGLTLIIMAFRPKK